MRLLVVDDDPRLRDYLGRGLREAGHECETAADGAEARAAVHGARFDLVLLDVMLPDEDGWTVLDDLRREGDDTPVIFVTARDAVAERVRGLEAGADDYLIKPFAFDELLARVTAVARRRQGAAMVRGALKIDPIDRHAELDGKRIELSPREFDLLVALARADGRTLSRPDLLRSVWGIEFDPGTNTVDVHVGRLRRRLGSAASCIQTVVGEGYRLLSGEPGR